MVPDRSVLLRRLGFGSDDRRQVALLETAPSSGFVGAPGNAAEGSVTFVRNDPEHVTLRASAGGRGFVVLTDEYFPGWRATVDGVATPILRANYAFRLVEVPAGESAVDFRYVPRAAWIGAAVSGLTIAALGIALAVSARGLRTDRGAPLRARRR